jgi:hypothetical protein
MSQKFKIIDCDIIYLSYDEPNAEKNYADLLNKVPWAKRVHGVKGSDAAHKACARLSETDRFVTVDGDNIVHESFFNQELDFEENKNLSKCVVSWCGHNVINGLMYGNGGLKLWPKQYVLDMQTHENAPSDDPNAQVDFCWDAEYIQMNACFSDVYNNASPYQAWRAGFREGVKMSLDRGVRVKHSDFKRQVHWKNLHRLLIWMNVGADIKNGLWAILGARQGCYMTNCTDWDYIQVRDFEYLGTLWEELVTGKITNDNVLEHIKDLGNLISPQLDIPLSILDESASRFFRHVHADQTRISNNVLDKE